VHFLLSLIESGEAAAMRQRLGIGLPPPRSADDAVRDLNRLGAPQSALLWMLELDDPATNLIVFHQPRVPDAIRRDILRGVTFGGATGPLYVQPCGQRWCGHQQPQQLPSEGFGTIDRLRLAVNMKEAKAAVGHVTRDDWASVAAADLEEALPGYSRWALTLRIDCPPELRAQFGSHAKYTHRLRQAGIVEIAEYVETHRPSRQVLGVLQHGTRLFPHRVAEAAALLKPLVRDEIGASPDAWAVLAQLLPTFSGTVRELISTSGAIAHV
jgi:hypothetical protein